jgi:hypothetical protein
MFYCQEKTKKENNPKPQTLSFLKAKRCQVNFVNDGISLHIDKQQIMLNKI